MFVRPGSPPLPNILARRRRRRNQQLNRHTPPYEPAKLCSNCLQRWSDDVLNVLIRDCKTQQSKRVA